MDQFFGFAEIYDSEWFFLWTPEQPPIATVQYIIKYRKERICPSNTLKSLISSTTIINLCNKIYINHQQNIAVDKKPATKNLQSNQDMIIYSTDKGGKIVIMNRNEYIEEHKMQKATIGQYFLRTNKNKTQR